VLEAPLEGGSQPSSPLNGPAFAPYCQRYARVRARFTWTAWTGVSKPTPVDITGYPIRVIPSGRRSFSADIGPYEPLFRLTQAGVTASPSLARFRWVDDPRLSLNSPISAALTGLNRGWVLA